MNQKKLIIFGCSITPFFVIIGTIIYSSSSKNNVHQNNLQLEKEKKEDLQNVNEEKKEIKSDINSPEKIEKKEEKKEKSIKNQKVLIKNQNQEEEYIPFLDNTKIQMGLWFIYPLIFFFWIDRTDFYYLTENIKQNLENFYTGSGLIAFVTCFILVPLCFLAGEFIFSFIVYLPACWINKKPCQKAFSVYHRFWCQSWTKVLLSFLIIEIFGFIDFVFLEPLLKYVAGFIAYQIYQRNKKTKTIDIKL